MQSYTEIPSSQSLQSSLALLLNNDKTAISCSAGTAFPTSNLQVGMLCLRTDVWKLYQLKDTTPTWVAIADLVNGMSVLAANVLVSKEGNAEGGQINLEKPTSGSTLTGNVGIDVSGDRLRIFDVGTNNGFYIDIAAGMASQGAKLWHSNNDGSGSGLDADLVDGYEASTATTANTIPVRDANGKLPGDLTGNAATATSATTAATATNATNATTAATANALNTANTYKGVGFVTSGAANGYTFNDRTTDTNFWQWYSTGNVAYLYSGVAGAVGNRFTFDSSGNFTAVANITAYSDETLKANWRGVSDDFVFALAGVKSGIFDRTDMPGLTQVGVSAQSLRAVLPNAVVENKDGLLSVSYGNAAMLACVELAKAVVELSARLKKLEAQ